MEQRLNSRTGHADFWKEYNKSLNLKLDESIKDIHLCYERRSNLIALIDLNKDYYNTIGIDISIIYSWTSFSKIDINNRKYDIIEPLKLSYLKGYNYLTDNRIPVLNKRIKVLNRLRNIPFTIYTSIQEEYNNEISNYILKGNRFKLGKYLGSIILRVFPKKTNDGIRKINWVETNKLKEKLLADGETLKSKDNPHGKYYIIYYEDNIYAMIKWDKRQCQIEHRYYYKFRPIANTNFVINDLKPNNIEDIFNNHGLGMYEKLSAIRIHYPYNILNLIQNE